MPAKRADGIPTAGVHRTTIEFDFWKLHGKTGELSGAAGLSIKSLKSPITEHIKEILRGRKEWGIKHILAENWAELPAGTNALSYEASMPGPSAKRARASRPEATRMASLA